MPYKTTQVLLCLVRVGVAIMEVTNSRKRKASDNESPNSLLPSPSTISPIPPNELTHTLEPNIFNSPIPDDFLRIIADFLFDYIDTPNVEIEAKLGVLIDKNTQNRIHLPIESETVLSRKDDRWFRFSSDMTREQHKFFNTILNKRTVDSKVPGFKGFPVSYKHTRETDSFYPKGRSRIRVTRDSISNEVVPGGILEKKKIASLNIYSPSTKLDYRISVNSEIPVNEMPNGEPTLSRKKDRLCYSHQLVQVDLTQVQQIPQQNSVGSFSQVNSKQENWTHELELEFMDPSKLIEEKRKALLGQPHHFQKMVAVFLSSVRYLCQKCI